MIFESRYFLQITLNFLGIRMEQSVSSAKKSRIFCRKMVLKWMCPKHGVLGEALCLDIEKQSRLLIV